MYGSEGKNMLTFGRPRRHSRVALIPLSFQVKENSDQLYLRLIGGRGGKLSLRGDESRGLSEKRGARARR